MFTVETVSDLRWSREDHSAIDCIVKFAEFDVPGAFTATATDPYAHTQEIWTKANAGDYGAIAAYVAPEVPAVRSMSVLTFMDRFTEAEQIAIVGASMSDAPLKLWYDRMLAASFVNLDDDRTIAGVEALAPSLLANERVDEVLGR